jgi:hypothetical protein
VVTCGVENHKIALMLNREKKNNDIFQYFKQLRRKYMRMQWNEDC